MSTDPSTTEQIAAAVLAEHATYDTEVDDDRSDESTVFWQYRCKCGYLLPAGGFADQRHRTHQAQQIAARLDDRSGCSACDEWETQYDLAMGEVNRLRTLLDQTRTEADR